MSLRSEAESIISAATGAFDSEGKSGFTDVGSLEVRREPRQGGIRTVVAGSGTKVVLSPDGRFAATAWTRGLTTKVQAVTDPADKRLVFSQPEVRGPFGLRLPGKLAEAVAARALGRIRRGMSGN